MIGIYISLTKGKFALVDRELYEEIIKYKWHYSSEGYAKRSFRLDGKSVYEFLHQFVMFKYVSNYDEDIDHKNRDRLDCRKENLRLATRSQSLHNSTRSETRGEAKYKGVSIGSGGRPRAKITTKSGIISLGRYDTEELAADAYDNAAIVFFGEFANLNCSWLNQ